jgi:hypothetical protein
MFKNVIIINNELSILHFSGEKSAVFFFSFDSEKEINIPNNSPEMTVLRSFAYANNKKKQATIAKNYLLKKLTRSTSDLTLKDISVEEVTEDTALVLLSIVHESGNDWKELYTLKKQKNGYWIVGFSVGITIS